MPRRVLRDQTREVTDNEAIQTILSMRGVLFKVRCNGDKRTITVGEGQRRWVDFEFDEEGFLTDVVPDCW